MSKFFSIFLSVILALYLSSCAFPRPSTGPGLFYTEVTEGISANNNVVITKKGEACNDNIMGIVVKGNQTIEAAKANGNITNVASIDRYYKGVLGFYAKACTIIQGN